jgi:hypothetical protein
MRFMKHLTIGLAAAALAATSAAAHDGKPNKNGDRCKPAPVLLAGTLANDPAAGDSSFQLNVKHANRLGRLYGRAANPVTVSVDDQTRYRKGGEKSALDALAQNDRALVFAKVCRADVKKAKEAGAALPALMARKVLAKAPKQPDNGSSEGT